MDHITMCKTKVGASDEDVARHMAYEGVTTMTGKCFVLCLQESFGLVSTKPSSKENCDCFSIYFFIGLSLKMGKFTQELPFS